MIRLLYLLDLVWAIGRRHVHDESQFPSRVFDVLSLELFALCVVGPRQTLVDVQGRVEAARDEDEPPANRLQEKPTNQKPWNVSKAIWSKSSPIPFRILNTAKN